MPIARVQMPDGRIGKFEVPEGTTPEQVESFVFNMKDTKKETAKEPNLLQKIDRAITPDFLANNPVFKQATQFASGAIEGAASVPMIPFDLVRAAGQTVGVPDKYLPYGSQNLNQGMQDAGVTQPEFEGGGISRFAGNVAGSSAAFPTKTITNVAGELAGAPKALYAQPIPQKPNLTKSDKKVLQAFERDKINPSSVGSRMNELGPEATLADVGGENVKGLARATTSIPGPGREIASEALQQRQFGQSSRVSSEISKSLGSGELFYNNVEDLLKARSEQAAPFYERAVNSKNIIPNEKFKSIFNDPFLIQVMDKVKSDPLHGLGNLPNNSMKVVDATKKSIDDMIDVAKRSGEGNKARLLMQAKEKLVNTADDAFPAYKTARDKFAGPSQLVNALENGREFIKGDSEITKSALNKMSDSERQFFRIGAARSLRDKVLNTPDTADTVKKIFNTPLMREKLRTVFPSNEEFNAFEKMMNTESTMFQTRSSVMAGSRTAPLQAEMLDAVSNVASVGKIGTDILQGNFGSAAMGAISKLKSNKGLSPEESEALAKILFSRSGDKNIKSIMSSTGRFIDPTKLRNIPSGTALSVSELLYPEERKNGR